MALFKYALFTVDFEKLEQEVLMIYAGCVSFFRLGLENGHVPTLLGRKDMK